jgi:Flp pilus assembly protein CpaB
VVTAVAAVVLAALAGVLVWQYTDEADERAEQDQELVEVYVAAAPVQRGVSGADALQRELLVVEEMRRADFDRLADPIVPGREARIRDRIAAATIPEGVPVVAGLFVERGQLQGSALEIEEGMQAISLSVDLPRGVAGFVAPGDSVNVLFSFEAQTVRTAPGGPVRSGRDQRTTAFLVAGAKVLAVDRVTTVGAATGAPTTDTNGDGVIDDRDEATTVPANAGLITLAVTPRQAEQIAAAMVQNAGGVYLTLNPPEFTVEDFQNPTEIVEAVNLYDQPLALLDEVLSQLERAQPSP